MGVPSDYESELQGARADEELVEEEANKGAFPGQEQKIGEIEEDSEQESQENNQNKEDSDEE